MTDTPADTIVYQSEEWFVMQSVRPFATGYNVYRCETPTLALKVNPANRWYATQEVAVKALQAFKLAARKRAAEAVQRDLAERRVWDGKKWITPNE